jgi:hypothetical protein
VGKLQKYGRSSTLTLLVSREDIVSLKASNIVPSFAFCYKFGRRQKIVDCVIDNVYLPCGE